MLPPNTVTQMPPRPGAASGPAGASPAIRAFRKALGVPENQAAPESKVIDAVMGKMGPDIKRMAAAVVGATNAPTDSQTMDRPDNQPPTTEDSGQSGGEPSPPDPSGPPTGDASSVQPGASTHGAASIFARKSIGTIGDQPAGSGGPEDDDDEPGTMPSSKTMFRRRR